MENEITRSILDCRNHVSLLSNVGLENIQTWFKSLCDMLTTLLNSASCYAKKPKLDESFRKDILFYSEQLMTLLSLLIEIVSKERDAEEIISQARCYVQRQLTSCFDGITNAVGEVKVDECRVIAGKINFLSQMELCLGQLEEVDASHGRDMALNKYNIVRNQIEQALCNAMSVAHIAYAEDFMIIKGGCKSVLNALDSLHLELESTKPNVAMCDLSVDSCYDKLCCLERKVNVAVLKLSLKEFPQCIKLLEDLHEHCINNRSKRQHFEEMIVDFDLHVDRITQIVMFAIDSSLNIRCGIKMQSYLARLEALANELIPNLRSIISEKSSLNIQSVSLLKCHWFNQMAALRGILYSIIDPLAFCQVTLEELQRLVGNDMKIRKGVLNRVLLEPILNYTETLMEVVVTSVEDIKPKFACNVKNVLRDLRQVLHETKAAVQILLVDGIADEQGSFRIIKRCRIMLSIIKKLVRYLSEDEAEKFKGKVEQRVDQEHAEKSINILNDDHQLIEIEDNVDNKVLNNIVKRGKEILAERSLIVHGMTIKKEDYNERNSEIVTIMATSFTGCQQQISAKKKLRPRNFKFSYSKLQNDASLDLQLTEILSDLKNISASFS